ncbi:MAG: hypothetical protein RMJ87_08545 [Cytophagales bacterium]|nr:hypothetical protein [Cytophagales bacterium]
METKRDTVILELIKYLVNSDKHLPREISDVVIHNPSSSTAQTSYAEMGELLRHQQQTNRKLDELKVSIESLCQYIQTMSGKENGNGYHQEPRSQSLPATGTINHDKLYQEILQGYAETAEEKLQTAVGEGLIAQHNSEFFIWSGQWKHHICIFYLQAENNAISHQILSLIGSEAVLSMQLDDRPEDMMLHVNRKIHEFYLRHPSLPQKLRVSLCLIDKRQAKVLFAGAHVNLIQIDEEGLHIYEGSKAFAGTSPTPHAWHTTHIRRGVAFFLYGGNMSNELEKLLKKIAEESSQDKKSQLNKWLAKKNNGDVVIGFSF